MIRPAGQSGGFVGGQPALVTSLLVVGGGPIAAVVGPLCRQRMANCKYPRRVQIVQKLPKGPSGKTFKAALKKASTGMPVQAAAQQAKTR